MTVASLRPAWVEVDLEAIGANVERLRDLVAPARLCAVVKADAYGHGMGPVAAAALEAGAALVAVATAEEAIELRDAGVTAPILLLAEVLTDASATAAVAAGVVATVGSVDAARRLAAAAISSEVRLDVHLKVDTGMHRLGVPPEAVVDLARAVESSPALRRTGTWTHLAVADDPRRPETGLQLSRFDDALGRLRSAGLDPGERHAANSPGAILHPAARYDLVRCGIATFGVAPCPAAAELVPLRPAMSIRAQVSRIARVPAGEGVSYGLRGASAADRWVATVPVGYADGIDRGLGDGVGEVLVGGRRRPVVGAVTMDHLMVDLGDDAAVRVGDDVVLLGAQGDEHVDAAEWAERLGTIPYEVVARIGVRLPRVTRR